MTKNFVDKEELHSLTIFLNKKEFDHVCKIMKWKKCEKWTDFWNEKKMWQFSKWAKEKILKINKKNNLVKR